MLSYNDNISCKEIGIIKEAIKEAILEGVIPNSYQQAYELMLEKGKALGLNKSNETSI